MTREKQEYIIINWDRPHGHERIPTNKKILLTEDEAYDLNKLLTLNGENKRYIKLWNQYIILKTAITGDSCIKN
mgnify:CR=1 FL=1